MTGVKAAKLSLGCGMILSKVVFNGGVNAWGRSLVGYSVGALQFLVGELMQGETIAIIIVSVLQVSSKSKYNTSVT